VNMPSPPWSLPPHLIYHAHRRLNRIEEKNTSALKYNS
jgi:hypothetical protein